MVCTLGFFTACSSDDDDDKTVRLEALEGTWNVTENSAKIDWQCPADLGIDVGPIFGVDYPFEWKIQETIAPMVSTLANSYLPKVLKNVTFTANGKISATYAEANDDADAEPVWKTADNYATYKVVNENLITVFLNTDQIASTIEDVQTRTMVVSILSQYSAGFPVNISWSADKKTAFFYVNKEFVQPVIASLAAMLDKIPTDGLDEEDAASLKMIKALASQLPGIMEQTTKFDAGIELTK